MLIQFRQGPVPISQILALTSLSGLAPIPEGSRTIHAAKSRCQGNLEGMLFFA